jgi:hypothetical protein
MVAIGGFVLSFVPVAGALLSFGAPILALAGIVTGGIAMQRAGRDGEPSGLGAAGLVVSILAFIPSLVVALTCGLCSACVTAGMLAPDGRLPLDASAPVPALGDQAPAANGPVALVPDGAPPPAFPPPPFAHDPARAR